MQYAVDNVDHNSRTLDGHNTFHGMGMIIVITPENQCTKPIPRVKVTYKDVAIVVRVPIHFHKEESWGQRLLSSKICAVLRPRIKKLTLIICGSHPSCLDPCVHHGWA